MRTAADVATHHLNNGAFEAAEETALEAIRGGQDDPAIRLAYATSLAKQLCFGRAVEQCLHILNRADGDRAQHLGALRVLACCATQLGEPDMVRPFLDAAGFERAEHPIMRSWRPRILARIGATDEAHRELVALREEYPDDPLLTGLFGQVLMEMGRPEGLRYELALMGRAFFAEYYPGAPAPERMWQGEPLAGRSIVILPHGGFGDVFDAYRYARILKDLGAGRVTAVMGAKGRRLIASAGVDAVLDPAETQLALAGSDLWVPAPGLKHAALYPRGQAATTGGYLAAPDCAAAAQTLREIRRQAGGRPCLGLYWHSDRDLGEQKSVPLPAMLPVFARRDIHWVILQRGFGLRQMCGAGLGAGASVLGDDLSFDETAAIMAGLDGVVAICAWAFHLAGALGLRSFMLAGRVLDSRHLNRERGSVLYADCATLVRQPRIGDWPGAVAHLNAELDAFATPLPPAA